MRRIIKNLVNSNGGQSVLEIVTALAIFALLSTALVTLILGNFDFFTAESEMMRGQQLADAGMNAVEAVRDEAWNNLIYSRSAVGLNGNQWELVGEGTTEQLDKYKRTIDFFPIYRNENGEISSSADAYLDVQSKEVEVNVSWQKKNGSELAVHRRKILSNWRVALWRQNDWSGGEGEEVWSEGTVNKFKASDGNLDFPGGKPSLKEVATSTFASSGELESSAFFIPAGKNFTALEWREDIPADCPACNIRLQIKTAKDIAGTPDIWTATWSGPDGEDGDEDDYFEAPQGSLINLKHNSDQWLKYRVLFDGDGAKTPRLEEVRVVYVK